MTWDLSDFKNAVDTRDDMRQSYAEMLQQLVIASEQCLDESYSGDAGDVSSDFEHLVENKVKKIREHLDLMGSHQSLIEAEIKNSEELVKLGVDYSINTSEISELMSEEGCFR